MGNSIVSLKPAQFVSDWETLKRLVLDSVSALATKRLYSYALDQFCAWYFAEPRAVFSKAVVQEYRSWLQARHYAPSTVALHMSALRKLALEAADNGLLDPAIASAIARVKGPKRLGRRLGNWLTLEQASVLIRSAADEGLKGVRDQAILALAIGCGLRRGEIAMLTVSHLQIREGRWVVLDLIGKAGRIRTVPVPALVKEFIDNWLSKSGINQGRLFVSVGKGGRLTGTAMTAQAVYEVVTTYSCRLGFRIAPHDLRRTFAHLAYVAQAPLEQIQYTLGHGSLMTTERYLGVRQDLVNAPGDRIRLNLR